MTHPAPPKPTAKDVANHFVKFYYQQLTTKPEGVYRFYKDSGCLIHDSPPETLIVDPNQSFTEIAAEGKEATQEYFTKNARFFKDAVISDIQNMRSDFSQEGAVIVMVMGLIQHPGHTIPMRFVQTFYLQKEKKESHNYALRNDVLRYIPPGFTPQQNALVQNLESENHRLKVEVEQLRASINHLQMQAAQAQAQSAQVEAAGETQNQIMDAPQQIFNDQMGWQTDPSPPADTNGWEDAAPAPTSDPVEAPVVAAEAYQSDTVPTSEDAQPKQKIGAWSDLFRGAPKGNNSNDCNESAAVEQQEIVAEEAPPTTRKEGQKAHSSYHRSYQARSSLPQEYRATHLTIHVKGVTTSMKKANLKNFFQEKFGEVRDVDVYAEKGYGFVYFKNGESVTNALEVGEVIIEETTLSLGAKRENSGKGKGRGRGRGGGRGKKYDGDGKGRKGKGYGGHKGNRQEKS